MIKSTQNRWHQRLGVKGKDEVDIKKDKRQKDGLTREQEEDLLRRFGLEKLPKDGEDEAAVLK